jgi:adenylosuccinate synthase
MSVIAVVGLLWGDEGKGKIVDLLSHKAALVVRYQGGTNAGHTVYFKGEPLPLHLVPSGIFNKETVCVIGNGCVIDLKKLYEEIVFLEKEGIDIKGRLFISDRAHVTFPFHIEEDEKGERDKGKQKVGTTAKGVGPTYTDKHARIGIRMVDILSAKTLRRTLKLNLKTKKYPNREKRIERIMDDISPIVKKIKECVVDTVFFLNEEIDKKKNILFEGAQGSLLDIDFGTYPYVTSSNPTVGGICTGSGVSASRIERVLGVTKAYATRVGKGPFPTKFEDDFEEQFRKEAKEFGATTGRPRRCGWFDSVGVRYGCMINGVTSMAITKLDCLAGIEKLKVCVAYKNKDGQKVTSFPADTGIISETEPVYEEFEGWEEDIRGVSTERRLPGAARNYLQALEDIVKVRIDIVSTGPGRKETIVRNNIW